VVVFANVSFLSTPFLASVGELKLGTHWSVVLKVLTLIWALLIWKAVQFLQRPLCTRLDVIFIKSGSCIQEKDLYEYNARNQVSLWGPRGELLDYADKHWASLMKYYYK